MVNRGQIGLPFQNQTWEVTGGKNPFLHDPGLEILIENGDVDPEVLKYVNRLSDFLFTIARLAARLDSKDETIYTRPPPQDASGYVPLEGSTDIWKKTSKKDD